MRKSIFAAVILGAAAALLFGGCAAIGGKGDMPDASAPQGEAETAYHELSQVDAKARMDSGDELIILDVRTKEEFDDGHIEGAILLPNEDIGTEMPPELPDRDAEILVYCRSGNRSGQAARKLADMGYTAVYDFGGINSWEYGTVTD